MVVGIDTRPLTNDSASRGIGMYTKFLVEHLRNIEQLEVVEISKGNLPEKVDLVHYPWFDLYYPTLPLSCPRPRVVTVHDLTPLVLQDLYPAGLKGKLMLMRQKWALKHVAGILTDSVASKKDIIKIFAIDAERVHAVHLAPQGGFPDRIGNEAFARVRKTYDLPKEFVLYVGDVNRNKNLPELLAACRLVGLTLVVVGKQAVSEKYDRTHPENADLVILQHEAKVSGDVRLLGFVSSEDLAVLFKLASVYCQPSLYEGFGLPVLEAMSCGCPVVVTRRGSLPEIAGEAAVYAEPESKSLAKAIQFVTNLPDSGRARLIKEGYLQVKKFSWMQTARQTLEVYEQVLRGA